MDDDLTMKGLIAFACKKENAIIREGLIKQQKETLKTMEIDQSFDVVFYDTKEEMLKHKSDTDKTLHVWLPDSEQYQSLEEGNEDEVKLEEKEVDLEDKSLEKVTGGAGVAGQMGCSEKLFKDIITCPFISPGGWALGKWCGWDKELELHNKITENLLRKAEAALEEPITPAPSNPPLTTDQEIDIYTKDAGQGVSGGIEITK